MRCSVRGTYRPLGVQQDVCELQDQSVGRLVVGLPQGVRKQLGARGLNDHLGGHRHDIIQLYNNNAAVGRASETSELCGSIDISQASFKKKYAICILW